MRTRKPVHTVAPIRIARPSHGALVAPLDLMTLQRHIGNRVFGQVLAAPSTGCGCGACGPPSAPLVTRLIAQRTPGGLIQRTQKDYDDAFIDAFYDGFREGFSDGLDELLENEVIDRQTFQQLIRHYQNNGVITLAPIDRSDFDPHEGAFDHRESGQVMGNGKGIDYGYEHAITAYGYSRQYAAIPSGNKQQALQDNHGMCVYCNAQPSADVDHVEPLKQHWLTGGATMELNARSAEANQINNLVGACATCNRSKGAKRLGHSWWPGAWGGNWWPWGPARAINHNNPPPCW